jgi:NAD(P)-dependent dehydrogenase (short-subunit alcohol dehydrogenase family)
MELKDKVVIITGASGGIGYAAAKRFAAAGAKVVLAARSADKLSALAAELRAQGQAALPVPTDVCDPAAVQALVDQAFAHFGRIDILVNNAGQAAAGTVAAVNPDHYRAIIELNLFGPLYAIQAAVPKMRQGGGGLIINISSMVSKMKLPALGTYASTKAALNMLSDTARVELEPDHIRVVTVYPRMTATDFGKNSLGDRATRHGQRSQGAAAYAPDTADFVAGKIVEAAEQEPADQYMDAGEH